MFLAGLIIASTASLDLAQSYLKDQDDERSFKTFLTVLDETKGEYHPASKEEEDLYSEALKEYLNTRLEDSKNKAAKMIEKYEPILEKHTDYYKLSYIVAAAYANLGLYPEFYKWFYPAYKNDPGHYLAFKSKACLHIKLFERAKTPDLKEKEREKILELLHKAQDINPQDVALYKIEFAFTSSEKLEFVKKSVLNKMISLPMIPSRSDTAFFLELAYELNDKVLIQKWLSKALEAYPGSKMIEQIEREHGK